MKGPNIIIRKLASLQGPVQLLDGGFKEHYTAKYCFIYFCVSVKEQFSPLKKI